MLVIGPGLGTSAAAQDVLLQALQTATPLVIDADALNLIAGSASLQAVLAQRVSPTLMTPHPLEAARLLGISSIEIQADRLQAARRLAHSFNAVVVLKGSGTVIADRHGTCCDQSDRQSRAGNGGHRRCIGRHLWRAAGAGVAGVGSGAGRSLDAWTGGR